MSARIPRVTALNLFSEKACVREHNGDKDVRENKGHGSFENDLEIHQFVSGQGIGKCQRNQSLKNNGDLCNSGRC